MSNLFSHKLTCLLLLCASILTAGGDGFLHFFAEEHPQLLLIPSEWSALRPMLEEQTPTAPYAASCADKCLAVAIPANTSGTIRFTDSPATTLPTSATFPPVHVTRQAHSATSRAFTPAEILRHFAYITTRKAESRETFVTKPGERPAGDDWRHSSQLGEKKRPSLVDFWRWEATFCLAEDASWSFGSNQELVCWALWIDGQAVADWRNLQSGPAGQFFGPTVRLEKGLHTLQFLVIQKSDEPLPACLFRLDGSQDAGQELTNLLPFTPAPKLEAGHADQPLLSCTLQVEARKTFASQLGDSWTATHFVIQGQNSAPQSHLTPLGGWPALTCSLGEETVLSFAGLPRLAIGVKAEELRWRWLQLPLAVAPGQALAWRASLLNASCLGGEFAPWRQVQAECLDLEGKVLEAISLDWSDDGNFQAVTALPAGAKSLRLRLVVGEFQPAEELSVRLLAPLDDFADLTASGDCLEMNGTRVVLCPDQGRFPLASDKSLWSNPRLILLTDDSWQPSGSDSATALERALPGWQLLTVAIPTLPGCSETCRELLGALSLLNQNADLALLNLGEAARLSGLSASDWLPCLRFCAQAFVRRGKAPLLMTFPAGDDFWRGSSRDYAHSVKRLAAEMRLPILDLYSFPPTKSAPATIWQPDRFSQSWTMEAARQLRRLRQDALHGQRRHFDE